MRKIVFILLTSFLSISTYAQTSSDSILWEKMMRSYVKALESDIQYNKELSFNRMLEAWKKPLARIYDKDSVEAVKTEIETILTDSLTNYTEEQKEKMHSVIKLLVSYETEAQRMIGGFKITDSQMLDNLKYCNSATIVHSFSLIYLRKWYEQSLLPTFAQSKIPYLAQIACELKQMLENLCEQKKSTPELLQNFLNMEFRISTGHTKTEEVK